MEESLISRKDHWEFLKNFTDARIAMGRTGNSIPTKNLLEFQLAHAKARDAVHSELNFTEISDLLNKFNLQIINLHSSVHNRMEYLQRPDLGRKLNEESKTILNKCQKGFDLSIVIADGLSSFAIKNHLKPFLENLLPELNSWRLAPLSVVKEGRVAIGDEIAQILEAEIVVILIGERPGLSSPDSMGIYLTYAPKSGLTDESRNCISNVRPAGLNYSSASKKLLYLLNQSRSKKLSGVNLKDEMIQPDDWKLIN